MAFVGYLAAVKTEESDKVPHGRTSGPHIRGSLFSREFAGVTGLMFKAIHGRDGCTRDFACGRYENLSGAISWLTFFPPFPPCQDHEPRSGLPHVGYGSRGDVSQGSLACGAPFALIAAD
jgi:hypothetical protein